MKRNLGWIAGLMLMMLVGLPQTSHAVRTLELTVQPFDTMGGLYDIQVSWFITRNISLGVQEISGDLTTNQGTENQQYTTALVRFFARPMGDSWFIGLGSVLNISSTLKPNMGYTAKTTTGTGTYFVLGYNWFWYNGFSLDLGYESMNKDLTVTYAGGPTSTSVGSSGGLLFRLGIAF